MAFSDQQLEDLKSRADVVALVGRRVTLRRTGKDYVGLCPFHGEKSPSFYVIPGKQLWHCFGCGESGDIYKFYMKLDGMPFVDAVNLVARESGVMLVDEKLDPEEARRRAHLDALAELMERAVKFYEQKLWHSNGRAAQEHLVKRGVREEAARRFALGFGGHGMDELARALEKAGASVPMAVEAGLLIASQRGGRPFDRFHGRLVVPIKVPRPPHGRSVALGGRFLEGVTPSRHDQKSAKYINSPETPLYQKGAVLFGLDQARDTIRKTERAVVVEGYFDVIGVHQAGLSQAVATCGTALTQQHLELLTRTGAREILFLFDGDAAGVRAARKAAELCAREQVPARVATLPDGVDPDEFARKGGQEALEGLFARAKPAIEHLIDRALSELGPSATVEERVRAVEAVREVVLAAPDGLSRELYVASIAERLHVSVGAVQAILYEPERDDRAARRGPGRAAEPDASFGPPPGELAPFAPVEPPALAPEAPSGHGGDDSFGLPPPTPPRKGFRKDFPHKGASRNEPPRVGVKWQAPPVSMSEAGVVLSLLAYPVALAPTVTQSGALAGFASQELRALGEAVVVAVQEGVEVAPATFVGAVQDPRLRRLLEEGLVGNDAALDQTAQHLMRLLDKVQLEARRRLVRSAYAQGRGSPADEADQRAFEEEQRRLLEESRELHRRIRERESRR